MNRTIIRFHFDGQIPSDDIVDVLETSLVAARGLHGEAVVAVHADDVRLDAKSSTISVRLGSQFAWDLVRILAEFCLESFDEDFQVRRIEEVATSSPESAGPKR